MSRINFTKINKIDLVLAIVLFVFIFLDIVLATIVFNRKPTFTKETIEGQDASVLVGLDRDAYSYTVYDRDTGVCYDVIRDNGNTVTVFPKLDTNGKVLSVDISQ
jgi:hypothetical protein